MTLEQTKSWTKQDRYKQDQIKPREYLKLNQPLKLTEVNSKSKTLYPSFLGATEDG